MAEAGRPRVLVEPDGRAVAVQAAEVVADALGRAGAARGVAHWATTGGSSAPPLYEALLRPDLRARAGWRLVHTWWGDDRFVPESHPLSNVQPFSQVLANGLRHDLVSQQLHPMPMSEAIGRSGGTPWVAARYTDELREAGLEAGADGVPILDLIVLGVGPDGHILSVFPGSAVWDSPATVQAVPAPTHIEPHVARVTLHPAVVRAAREVLVISTGAAKAPRLAEAWAGAADVRALPVATARLGTATWVLDEAAASELPVEARS